MGGSQKSDDDFIISFSDLAAICKRGKKKIFFGMAAFSLFSVCYTLTNPIEYIAEATFKDKARAGSGIQSLTGLLLGTSQADSDAMTLLKSRTVSEELVKRLGLQAHVTLQKPSVGMFEDIYNNLKVEAAIFSSSLYPSLKDQLPLVKATKVTYTKETPKGFCITFISEDTFAVFDGPRRDGALDTPFEGDGYKFTITRLSDESLKGKSFNITLMPLYKVADNISKLTKIEPDRMDRNLLNIKYGHRDRHLACEVVNTLTDVYKDYLQSEQNRIIGSQVAYLEQRQKEIGEKLKEMMHGHISNMSSDMKSIGFANTTVAMEFLKNTQNQMQQKLLDIEFEMKRLLKAQDDRYAYYDGYSLPGDPAIINHLLNEMRGLKQQADWLDLALRNAPPLDEEASKKLFSDQLALLDLNREYREEARTMMAELEQGTVPKSSGKLIRDPKYLVKVWHEKLEEISKRLDRNPEEWQNCQTQFCTYLNNLIHHFDVHESAIQERLAHQQNGSSEFQGIDLNTARELYVGYSRHLNDIESHILQHQFIVDRMDAPDFEMSSLSTIMNDYVSNETIVKAGRLALELKDHNNRSVKEQERLKEELAVQKRFLKIHLKNAIQLLGLKLDLTKYKIHSLQNVTMGLVQQQISLLEKHLSDYITTRIKDLKQEMDIIDEHKKSLHRQMAGLPEKWASEMLIEQQMAVNKKMIEEVSKLVENKIIGNNIEIVQSVIIDKALPPIHPKSPRLIFFAILGAFMGAFLTTTFVVVKELVTGLNASPVNLRLQNQHVSGSFTSRKLTDDSSLLPDQDLDVMRRLVAHLGKPESGKGQSLLLIKGYGPDFSRYLATLMAKQGLKILLMPLTFDKPADAQELPGLLQYLNGEADAPKIMKLQDCDLIATGGITRFSNELIAKEAFAKFIEEKKAHYDWVIGVSNAHPSTGEADNLLKIFNTAVVNVTDEKLDDLKNCMRASQEKKISFIFS